MRITQDFRCNTGTDYYLQQNPRSAPARYLMDFVAARAAGRRLLDFGCGIGAYSYGLRQRGFDTVGVDANPKYVEIARANGGDARLVDGHALPFPDKSIDTTFLLEVLEHLPDDVIRPALSEIRRVTKSNVLFTVPDNTQYGELQAHGFVYGHYHAVDHVQFFTVDNLRVLLQEYFPRVEVTQGDPIYPHRLLPPLARKAMSLMYRLGVYRSKIYSRLFVEAKIGPS